MFGALSVDYKKISIMWNILLILLNVAAIKLDINLFNRVLYYLYLFLYCILTASNRNIS